VQAQNISAKYIMKCDDDTFVRVETVLKEIKTTPHIHVLYMGKFNLFHKPVCVGKWPLTYEVISETTRSVLCSYQVNIEFFSSRML
jgi:hypothetical protein